MVERLLAYWSKCLRHSQAVPTAIHSCVTKYLINGNINGSLMAAFQICYHRSEGIYSSHKYATGIWFRALNFTVTEEVWVTQRSSVIAKMQEITRSSLRLPRGEKKQRRIRQLEKDFLILFRSDVSTCPSYTQLNLP